MRKPREPRKTIVFQTKDGRFAGKVAIRELGTNGAGNKHFNPRRPDGPVCECGVVWEPVCPNSSCAGNRIPRKVMRAEKGYRSFGHRTGREQRTHDMRRAA